MTWPTAGLAELAALSGFDFLVLDAEHGFFTIESIAATVAAADAAGIAAIVRVPSCAAAETSRCLDAGAAGILFPRGDGAASIRDAIAAARYPPEGRRGLGGVRANRYGTVPYDRHVAESNAATLLAAQIETPGALADLDAIAREPALDVLFVGPNDMTQALGIPGRFDDPRYGEALARVAAAARAANKTAGIMAVRREQVPELLKAGFRFLTVSDRSLVLESGRSWRAAVPRKVEWLTADS
ncbi:MAG TPA: aldolase/citrate lyase family protein [Thermoanaerobaculia bacterium]|nr:aldolase/citrate lyase family protein [Thermoanaerobaculia bacterium]